MFLSTETALAILRIVFPSLHCSLILVTWDIFSIFPLKLLSFFWCTLLIVSFVGQACCNCPFLYWKLCWIPIGNYAEINPTINSWRILKWEWLMTWRDDYEYIPWSRRSLPSVWARTETETSFRGHDWYPIPALCISCLQSKRKTPTYQSIFMKNDFWKAEFHEICHQDIGFSCNCSWKSGADKQHQAHSAPSDVDMNTREQSAAIKKTVVELSGSC